MGVRMSGGASWAMTLPSANSTRAWTMDWGWTRTSILSPGMPKSQWASTISRALLVREAESMVTLGPICHVGCLRARAGVAL